MFPLFSRVMRAIVLILVLLSGTTGCDPCAGLAPPPPPHHPDGAGTRLSVHLPHVGEVALKRWIRGPSGGRLERATRGSDGDLTRLSLHPFRLTLRASEDGIVFEGEAELRAETSDGAPVRRPIGLELPARILLRKEGRGVGLTADPRVLTKVTMAPLPDLAWTKAAEGLAMEVIPRILDSRPFLSVPHAPPGDPVLTTSGETLVLAWPAQWDALLEEDTASGAPSVGNSASWSVAAGELRGTPVSVDGPDGPLTATVLATRADLGVVRSTVRLEVPGRCGFVEADVPVAATVVDRDVTWRDGGDVQILREGGAVPDGVLDDAFLEGARAGLRRLRALQVYGPAGAPTAPVLARSTSFGLVTEINLGGLGPGSLTPPTAPQVPELPK